MMKFKRYMWLAICSAALLVAGCGQDVGSCVLISEYSNSPTPAIKAKYIAYKDGAHWFEVNGEIKAISSLTSSVIECGN